MPIEKNSDKRFMRSAIAAAKRGILKGQTPFGACVVRNGKIIVSEHNAVWKTTDITAHAEIQALRAACKKLGTIDLSGCSIYSTCEPCPMCFAACHWARISKIYFGASIADAKRAGFNELAIPNTRMRKDGRSPVRLASGLLLQENRALFSFWKKQAASKPY